MSAPIFMPEDDGDKPKIPEVNTPASPMGWYDQLNMLRHTVSLLPQQNLANGFLNVVEWLENDGYRPGGRPLLVNVDDLIDVFIQSATTAKYTPFNPKANEGVNHALNERLKQIPSEKLGDLVQLIATGNTTGSQSEDHNPDYRSQLVNAAIDIQNLPTIAEEDKNIGRS